MQPFARNLQGKRLSYNIELDQTVQELKQQVSDRVEQNVDCFKLNFYGTLLDETIKILETNLAPGNTIEMALLLKGC